MKLPRKNRRKIPRVFLYSGGVALFLGLLLLLCLTWNLEPLCERILLDKLTDFQAGGARFSLETLRQNRLVVTHLYLPENTARVAHIAAFFSPGELRRAQLRRLFVSGAEASIIHKDGKWIIPAHNWFRGLALPETEASETFPFTCPLIRIHSQLKIVHVDPETQKNELYHIPLRAELKLQKKKLSGIVKLYPADEEIALDIVVDPEGSGEFQCTLSPKNPEALLGLLPLGNIRRPHNLGLLQGRFTVELAGKMQKGQLCDLRLNLGAESASLAYARKEMQLANARLTAQLELEKETRQSHWEMDLAASNIRGMGSRLERLNANAKGMGADWDLRLTGLNLETPGGTAASLTGNAKGPAANRGEGKLTITNAEGLHCKSDLQISGSYQNTAFNIDCNAPNLHLGPLSLPDTKLNVRGNNKKMNWDIRWRDKDQSRALHSIHLQGNLEPEHTPALRAEGIAEVNVKPLLPQLEGNLVLDANFQADRLDPKSPFQFNLAGKTPKNCILTPSGFTLSAKPEFSLQLQRQTKAILLSLQTSLKEAKLKTGASRAQFSTCSLEAEGKVDTQGNFCDLKAQLTLDNGEVRLAEKRTLHNLNLSLPLQFHSKTRQVQTKPGIAFSIDNVQSDGLNLSSISATGKLNPNAFELAGTLQLETPSLQPTFNLKAQLRPLPSCKFSFNIPEFTFTPQEIPKAYKDLSPKFDFSTKVSANLTAALVAGQLSARAVGHLNGGRIILPEEGGTVSGIKADIDMELFPQLRSAPHQRLSFTRAEIGKFVFEGGEFDFAMDSPKDFFLERADIVWCKGHLETYALRFDTGKNDFDITVYARDLQLEELLDYLPNVKGSGEGKLYGRLPVFYKNERLGYRNGYLHSSPGDTGHLSLINTGPIDPALTALGPKNAEVVRSALRNFEYSLFRVDFQPDNLQDKGIRLRLVGKEADRKRAQPIHLNLNIRGALEDVLNESLKFRNLNQFFE